MIGAVLFCGAIQPPCDKCKRFESSKRKALGCEGELSYPLYVLDAFNLKLYRCPGRELTASTRTFMTTYSVCKSLNVLPVAGGLLNQTNHFVEAARIIESVTAMASKPDENTNAGK